MDHTFKHETPALVCVLKTGGPYDFHYVRRLCWSFQMKTKSEVETICITDDSMTCCSKMEPLMNNFDASRSMPGWWCFPEVFRSVGPTIVCGLDTVLVGDMEPFVELAESCPSDVFYLFRAFNNRRQWCNAFMVWNGDWSWIYSRLYHKIGLETASRTWGLEQDYVAQQLIEAGAEVRAVDDHIGGLYSFKIHIKKQNQIPPDTRAIIFHGQPRPHQVPRHHHKWIKDWWDI